jgi:dTDP-4-amino-4,6-dideoxygalactose transaminase
VLGVKLPHLDDWNTARRRIANAYHAGLADGIAKPAGPIGLDHVCHVYAIRVPDRERVRNGLAEAGISTLLHYPCPVHLQPAYVDLGYGPGDFPVSEALARETLSLPLFPELGSEQVAAVIDGVNRVVATELVQA